MGKVKIHGNSGKHHSLASRQKMSLSRVGIPKSEEWKKRLSESNKGKHNHIPWNKGLKGINCGINNHFYGKTHSVESRNKIKLARQKQIFPLQDTKIEIILQDDLTERSIKFITHKTILGQPDIFIEPNICIFADGCYWHGCKKCGFIKPEKNIKDERISKDLENLGYKVIRLWEHDIKNNIKELLDNKLVGII